MPAVAQFNPFQPKEELKFRRSALDAIPLARSLTGDPVLEQVVALRAELAELRAQLAPAASPILTGPAVVAEYQKLHGA